ncbi:MAG: IS66 family transposase [Polyangiaceae bacterium]|nr:IS66 family transposase [Polyangiaceae bacterium]
MGEGVRVEGVEAHVAALELELARERVELARERAERAAAEERLARVTQERDRLRASRDELLQELMLLKRRIFIAKAERVDTAQLELEFAEKLHQLDALAGTSGMPADEEESGHEGSDGAGDNGSSPLPKRGKSKSKSKGRRDLSKLRLPEDRVEITDPLYEDLVAQGKAERIGTDDSYELGFKRGGMTRVVIARVKYRVVGANGTTTVDVAPMPPRAFSRSLAAPSLLAHIVMAKYGEGLPLFRLEDRFARDGVPIDRGTMCRWLEDAGGAAGATVITAMRCEAMESFCLATDATGVLVQPIRTHEKGRQACSRGHYFVIVADRDHVFFEYTKKETSAAVEALFKGYGGYIQADAKSVYDILFRDPETPSGDDDPVKRPTEVGCWAHARRHFFEATLAKSAVAREGLARIGRIFELDASWTHEPPAKIKDRRDRFLRPHADAFFAWAAVEYEDVRHQRGLLRSALGYAVRQKEALMRVFDDGRLVLDNNRSERHLRPIAVGRKAWLFVGSDDHAVSAGHLLSLVASARLHRLDPEAYLRDFFRVLPHWPRARYLELAPKYWARTRERLVPEQLAAEIGPLTVPEPLPLGADPVVALAT